MATIYLSSTYEDLKDCRKEVCKVLRMAGHHVIEMEDYGAKAHRPLDQCLEDIKKADMYIGLLAFRYGYVPPREHNNPQGFSITELEYRCAETYKKPCFMFVVDDETEWPRKFDDAYTEADKGERIKRLRQHVLTEKLAGKFSTPDGLSSRVLAAVETYLREHPPISKVGKESQGTAVAIWDIDKLGSPYPGLTHCRQKYAPVFFGRDADVQAVLDRMRGPDGRFIIVSGSSGVGKSSLIDAGILPKIEKDRLPSGESCKCVRIVPSQHQDPWSALFVELERIVTRIKLKQDDFVKQLHQNPNALSSLLREIIRDGMNGQALVLFLDQMEELFTAQESTKTSQFLTALYHAAQEETLWVLTTIRSDHLQHCHNHDAMCAVIGGQGHHPLGPIRNLRLLVTEPARCAGLFISENLADQIVYDLGSDPGNLPILAFLLDQLFVKRRNRELTIDVYLAFGQVDGAIKRYTERVEANLDINAVALLPKLFQELVWVNAEGMPTRRRRLRSEFRPEMRELITALVDKGLLHTEGHDGGGRVSISLDKLFEAWPSLKSYVEVHKKQLVDQRLLEIRAHKWEQLGKRWFDGLAVGREYYDFRDSEISLTPLMKEYLHACRRASWIKRVGRAAVVGLVSWAVYQVVQPPPESVSPLLPEMVEVAGGTFLQGSIEGSEEQPIHEVTIKPFKIGKYEVTFQEYDQFVHATRRREPDNYGWGRDNRPVIDVSWDDARDYANWLSDKTNQRYRLPTESEWEYAARSEGKVQRWAGTSEASVLREYAVYDATSNRRTEPVSKRGERKPNGLKLYDMSGNVWEWVEDCWHENYTNAPLDGSSWLDNNNGNNGNCNMRVVRGGAWQGAPGDLRTSHRGRDAFDNRTRTHGFRLVLKE
mgnify:CR=1 FL=1